MKSTITNIVLEDERFRIFYTLPNGMEETLLCMPTDTAEDIKRQIEAREDYFAQLEQKVEDLKTELIN